jgi:anhydro-N-acetylmuramic acid kinase
VDRLTELRKRDSHLVIGLISGTSVDGIDAVLARISGPAGKPAIQQLAFTTVPYAHDLRREILAVAGGDARSPESLCKLDHAVGEAFAQAALRVLREAKVRPEDVDFVGSHGQTIFHDPELGATWQIGEATRIAAAVRCPVISDFRRADMAAGGQGAPLVPLFDALVFRRKDKSRVLLNIGGIANVTVLPKGEGVEKVFAFDTGPGNILLDEFVHRATNGRLAFDEGGKLAAAGTVDEELLGGFMEHPYFLEKPPKSTGREVFGSAFVALTLGEGARRGENLEDLVATLTEFTALSITESIREYVLPSTPVDEVFVSGGGVHNRTLVKRIAEDLGGITVSSLETAGFSPDAKEALAFALLARETVFGRPGNVPGATGAKQPVVLGHYTPAPLR